LHGFSVLSDDIRILTIGVSAKRALIHLWFIQPLDSI